MKVLTIKEPWASLIVNGYKNYETRTWKTKYRGELLIHAGKGIDKKAYERLKKYLPDGIKSGEIIGKVMLGDCILITKNVKDNLLRENRDIYLETEIGNYAWKLSNIQKINNNIKVGGKLSLWEYEI